jgi:hypothetical protein
MSETMSLTLGWIIGMLPPALISIGLLFYGWRQVKKTGQRAQFGPFGNWLDDVLAVMVIFFFYCFVGFCIFAGDMDDKGYNPGRAVSWWWQKEDEAAIDALVISAVKDLDSDGNWIDLRKYSKQYLEMDRSVAKESKGRKLYDNILKWKPIYVINSLVRQVVQPSNRPQVLFLAVKLGIKGSEERLVDVLVEQGDKSMAEDYLNCGSKKLYDGGQKWAQAHGYTIGSGTGSHRVGWGNF